MLFCLTTKDVQFTVIYQEIDGKIVTFKKVESGNFLITCNQKKCVSLVPFSNTIQHWFGVTGSHEVEAIE